MQVKGKIIAEQPMKSGVSASGKEWKSKQYVIEVGVIKDIPKRVAFDVLGDNIESFNLTIGLSYTLELDVQAKEWNGKWFNSVTAWKCQPDAPAQPQQTAPQPAPAPQQSVPTFQNPNANNLVNQFVQKTDDGLPF